MKRTNLFLALLAAASLSLAAKESFAEFQSYLKELDVTLNTPRNSKELIIDNIKYSTPVIMGGEARRGAYFIPVNNGIEFHMQTMPSRYAFASKDGEAAYLIPWTFLNKDEIVVKQGRYVEREIRAGAGNTKLNVTPLITVLTGEEAAKYSNADTVVLYNIQLRKQAMGKYDRCVGIYLRKYGHPAMLLKVLLTNTAYKNKDKYINNLIKAVRYGDSPSAEMLTQELRAATTQDLKFPTKFAPECTGIRMTAVDSALSKVFQRGGREALSILYDTTIDDEYCVFNWKSDYAKRSTGSEVSPVDSALQTVWDKGGKEASEKIYKQVANFKLRRSQQKKEGKK